MSSETLPTEQAAPAGELHQTLLNQMVANITPIIGVIASLLLRHPGFLDQLSKEILARIHGPQTMSSDEATELMNRSTVELTEAPIPGVSVMCGTLNGPHHPLAPNAVSFMVLTEGHLPDGSHGMVWQPLPAEAKLPIVVQNAFRTPDVVVGTLYYINLIQPIDAAVEKKEQDALSSIAKEVARVTAP